MVKCWRKSRRQDDGSWYRYYPYGAVAAHAVGYTHPRYGQSGAELQYTNELSGHMTSDRPLGRLVKSYTARRGLWEMMCV